MFLVFVAKHKNVHLWCKSMFTHFLPFVLRVNTKTIKHFIIVKAVSIYKGDF